MIISTNDGASENEVQVFNSGIVAGMQEGTDAKRMCHPELIELFSVLLPGLESSVERKK